MSVGNILKNRIYTGGMVQGRYRIKSYKIHVQEAVPEEEWFIVPNTHEHIISREDFANMQTLLKKDTRTAPEQKSLYLFSGFLRCADCGMAMTRSKSGTNVYYYCRTYKNQSSLKPGEREAQGRRNTGQVIAQAGTKVPEGAA